MAIYQPLDAKRGCNIHIINIFSLTYNDYLTKLPSIPNILI